MAATNTKIIEVKNLKKYFGKVKAVDGISFEVKKGEIIGFLGPNGAGKTTTIRCLMGFLKPSSGTIKVFGKDLWDGLVEAKGKIGYLSGNVRLYPNWSGETHIKYVESIRGKSHNARKYAEELNLDLSKKFKNLSSGNKQKLGLVLALMGDPELLIMDEPTVGLDPLLQNTIYDILKDLKDRGTTIFVSSHNLPEVEKICDRVAIIKEGKIINISNIDDLELKKLYNVSAKIKGKFTAKEFEFNGVKKAIKKGDNLSLEVEGDINPIIRKLGKYELEGIQINHASLEEIFLRFYQ